LEDEIIYRPEADNKYADALSRISSISQSHIEPIAQTSEEIKFIHSQLGHPGVDRQYNFMKGFTNSSFTMNQIAKVINDCDICAQLKPHFVRTPPTSLIDSKKPFQNYQ